MNWYEKHLGDWAKKCGHLTLAEEGAYNRLIDWCYAHEKPLPPGMRDVCRVARCTTPQERRIVERVVREFFELMDDGWHQSRIDHVLATFKATRPASDAAKLAAAQRQQRSRARRKLMFETLANHGVTPVWNATTRQLVDLFKEHGVTLPDAVTVTERLRRDESLEVTASQSPTTIYPRGADAPTVTGAVAPSRAGGACRAMRIAGVQDVNPSHPDLLRLLDAGATDDELRLAAAEASAKRKGFAYALAIVDGRRKDAALKGPASPGNGARSAAEEVVKAWAPALASRAPEAVFPIEAPK